MQRQKVKSSNVVSIGYDSMEQILEIEFTGGTVYQYLKVPEDVFVKLMTAESIGSAIHSLIKNKFTFKKAGGK